MRNYIVEDKSHFLEAAKQKKMKKKK